LPSAHGLGLGDVRLKLTRPICGTYGKQFSGFEFFLLPSEVHARPSSNNASRWAAESMKSVLIKKPN